MGGDSSIYGRDEKCIHNFSRKSVAKILLKRSRRRDEESGKL
jgi:hypothetical protein